MNDRIDPTITGITPDTTFEALSQIWLEYRRDHGKVRTRGQLAPQTLATYHAEIKHVIVPAIGDVRVKEATVPFLDRLLADVEHGRKHGRYPARPTGRSTRQLRVVLRGMLALAVAHDALAANPIRDAAPTARDPRAEVEFLTVAQTHQLRLSVQRQSMRITSRRMPNHDLEEFVDLLLGTGCREGEALAIRPMDLTDLTGSVPKLHVCGTMVEPRRGYIAKLHRQDTTKTGEDRTLILPHAVATMLHQRIRRTPPAGPDAPVFATRTGNWLSPSNMRTRFRNAISRAVASDPQLERAIGATTLHTLRRTVGTLLAHEVSLDAAREQLGHRDPSVTYQHYVGKRLLAPDLRETLDRLLAPLNGHTDIPPT